jgi:hypothetical protein
MKRYVRNFVGALVFMTALVVSTASVAQSPFDGTWKTNMAATKFSPKPNVFYLSQGWYHCVSCSPVVDVAANGEDQAVTGQAYDSVSVKEVDPKTIAVTTKKDGKLLSEQTRTVSADGKTLTVKTTSHPLNSDTPITATATGKLVGVAPAGVHATSGQWKIEKVEQSDNGLLTTYKRNGDELSMSTPTGESYTAKLDGNDYPVKGTPGHDMVSLKKIDAHTIEETDKRKGTVIEVDKMTVSPNGKTMTIVANNKLTDRTSTFVASKQ